MSQQARTTLLAFGLGVSAAVVTGAGVAGAAWLGFFGPVQTVYFATILYALVGSLIATRQPRNSVGWLMIAMALLAALSVVPFDLGAWLVTTRPGLRTAGIDALWLASWLWILPFGLGFPLIIVRFPTGQRTERWRWIDVVSVAGTVFFAFAMALRPGPIYPQEIGTNPIVFSGAQGLEAAGWTIGLVLLAIAYALAVTSLALRLRRAHGEERQQLKWMGGASALLVASFVFAATANVVGHVSLLAALVPLSVVSIAVPLALGVAILSYRLYDIDMIIDRALLYAALTAVLAGLYTLVIGLSQRLFVVYTGQRSDGAVLVTAFAVATAFTPVKNGLERLADRRIARRDPVVALRRLASAIDSVVTVLDTERLARQVVEDSVVLFGAAGAELYVKGGGADRLYHAGAHVDAAEAVVPLHSKGEVVGRLELGSRRGHTGYSVRELTALRAVADAIGEVFALASEPRTATNGGKV